MTPIARLVVIALGCSLAVPAAAQPAAPAVAQAKREMHGMSDAFSTAGVALAWGVLRGTGDAPAVVDVRIAVDPMTYPRVVVVARDPFGPGERTLASSLTGGLTDLRVARATFERYPRTEFRFFATARQQTGEAPALVVYFLGVPDTTPEFANEARLDAYLGERIVRAKAAAPKPP
jgi:hypothetical protein